MTSVAPRGPGARRRVLGALAVAAVLTTVVTVGIRPTLASWTTTANLGDAVGVASSTCTTPGVYRTKASSRFLAGSVAGVPLTGSGALAALTADNPASSATFSTGATPRGSDGASAAVSNSSVAGAVQAAGGVVGLTAPSGSQTQYAAATSTGRSVAGAGAVTTAGAVDTAGIAGGTRAAVGAVDVSAALGAVPGGTAAAGQLSQLGLTIGNAASVEDLNECARRWGASLSSALSRSASVSGLTLNTNAAAVSSLLSTVVGQRSTVLTGVDTLTGGSATSPSETGIANVAATGLVAAVNSALGAVLSTARAGSPTATVTITSDPTAANSATTAPRSAASGLVRLNGTTGTVTADLSRLTDPTSAQPNTALLSPTDVTSITSAVSTAAGALVSDVNAGLDTAVNGATVTVVLDVPIALAGLTIATVHESMTGTLAQVLAGTETWAPVQVSILSVLDAGALVSALASPLRTLLDGPIESAVRSAVATLGSTLTTARAAVTNGLTTLQGALPTQLATLAGLFSVTLNEQPDVAPYPTAAPGIGGGYVVTALRVHVRVAGVDALDLAIASSSVGPDTTINQ